MKKREIKSTRMPIYRDSGFPLDNAEKMGEAFSLEPLNKREPDHYIYSRYRNPTVVAAEEEIMKVEGCSWALLTQSGMAAVDVAVSIFQKGAQTRPWLFFTEIYGGTISFLDSILIARRGIKLERFAPSGQKYDLKKLEIKLKELKPEFVYFETISNPMLIVADGPAIINLCKSLNIKTIIDNTFSTPILWKPLESGADLVIHSATKYFSGHGNITAGVICGNDKELMSEAVAYRKFVGHMISPDDAYRLNSQILTFGLRFPQQCENAIKLSRLLEGNSLIEKVWYPGLESHESYNTSTKLFAGKGYGAMVTFSFGGSGTEEKRNRRDSFIESVREKIHLVSILSDLNTIIIQFESVW